MNIIEQLEKEQAAVIADKRAIPAFAPGDTLRRRTPMPTFLGSIIRLAIAGSMLGADRGSTSRAG